jgi:predicted nuclease of predicted toxin-antitoxin system
LTPNYQGDLLNGDPALLLISTGNISNFDLENLVQANLSLIAIAFKDHRFVEISNDGVITHA